MAKNWRTKTFINCNWMQLHYQNIIRHRIIWNCIWSVTNNLWSMIKALVLPLPTLNSPNRKVQRATVCKDRPRLLLQKSRKKFPINWEFLELGLSHVALRRATAEKPWTLVIARCLAGKVFHNLAKTLGAGSGQISSASQRFLQFVVPITLNVIWNQIGCLFFVRAINACAYLAMTCYINPHRSASIPI